MIYGVQNSATRIAAVTQKPRDDPYYVDMILLYFVDVFIIDMSLL